MLPSQQKNQDINKLLAEYLPLSALTEVCEMISSHGVHIKITKSRKRIHGSYYRPVKNHPHRITINHDLNPYAFLITLLHEFAHLYAWEYNRCLKHGKPWKQHFSNLLIKFIDDNVFPEDIQVALLTHLKHIKSSDFLDIPLSRVLQAYDKESICENGEVLLSDIPMQTTFIHDGRTFIKQKLLRKYYLCKELKTNKMYKYHPLAKVIPSREEN
ncbi:MAG: SprT-like domain-containing protein [Bacteroidales bacterium]|nr:SprT-like domain-containing protein [Bacteroidales bacterium]